MPRNRVDRVGIQKKWGPPTVPGKLGWDVAQSSVWKPTIQYDSVAGGSPWWTSRLYKLGIIRKKNISNHSHSIDTWFSTAPLCIILYQPSANAFYPKRWCRGSPLTKERSPGAYIFATCGTAAEWQVGDVAWITLKAVHEETLLDAKQCRRQVLKICFKVAKSAQSF